MNPDNLMYNLIKVLLAILSIVICQISNGQNLVPNPSFENYSSCPTNQSQFALAVPWFVPQNTWPASPDLYNGCDTTVVGIPNNIVGYQNANTGVGYAGIFTYGYNVREYIQVQLSSPLVVGNAYTVEMYVNPCNYAAFAIDAFGIYISTDSVFGTGGFYPLPYVPQISNPSGNIISDTVAWTLISGSYIALGGEKYITIGNFLDDASTNSFNFNPTSWHRGYYLIDDVSVSLSSSTAINELKDGHLNIFPNPFKTFATIKSDIFLNNASLIIYNSNGQQVKRINNIEGKTILLPRDNLTTGIYYMRLMQNNSNIFAIKFIITD